MSDIEKERDLRDKIQINIEMVKWITPFLILGIASIWSLLSILVPGNEVELIISISFVFVCTIILLIAEVYSIKDIFESKGALNMMRKLKKLKE